MNTLRRIPAVFVFEWRRAMTVPRFAWMLALACFPPVLLLIIRMAARSEPPIEVAAVLVYVLSPCVACMMGVFLWATPALSSELEGRSWIYLAVRPYGSLAVLLGKYLVAVTWSIPIGLVSSIVGSLVLMVHNPAKLMAVECGLVVLSCVAYSALFLLIGVIVPKRAMVSGIAYIILVEIFLAMVPAAVNLLTIQYRLRCLLVRWMEIGPSSVRGNPVFIAYFGEEGALWHLGALMLFTAVCLVVAGLVLRYREFTAAAETET